MTTTKTINLKKQLVGLDGQDLVSENKEPVKLGHLIFFVLNFPSQNGLNKDSKWQLLKEINASKEGEVTLDQEEIDLIVESADSALLSPSLYGILTDELL